MEAYLSDSRDYIVVLDERGEEEFTVEEFTSLYGKDALPGEMKSQNAEIESETDSYYKAFIKLCNACGRYSWAESLKRNVEQGNIKAEKIMLDTFKSDPKRQLAEVVSQTDRLRHMAASNLDFWSKRAGFKPMSQKDISILLRHLSGKDFRTKMRYRLRRNLKRQQLASARDLVIEVMRAIKKQPANQPPD